MEIARCIPGRDCDSIRTGYKGVQGIYGLCGPILGSRRYMFGISGRSGTHLAFSVEGCRLVGSRNGNHEIGRRQLSCALRYLIDDVVEPLDYKY
jgi:hypothetical protein